MGNKTDESDNSSCSTPTTLQKATHSSSTSRVTRLCQAKGCNVDLDRLGKAYNTKKRLCEAHMRADAVERRNGKGLWRFCQQCGKLEPLEEFDSVKRSCRSGLQRRREQSAAQSNQKKMMQQQQQQHHMFTEYHWMPQQAQCSSIATWQQQPQQQDEALKAVAAAAAMPVPLTAEPLAAAVGRMIKSSSRMSLVGMTPTSATAAYDRAAAAAAAAAGYGHVVPAAAAAAVNPDVMDSSAAAATMQQLQQQIQVLQEQLEQQQRLLLAQRQQQQQVMLPHRADSGANDGVTQDLWSMLAAQRPEVAAVIGRTASTVGSSGPRMNSFSAGNKAAAAAAAAAPFSTTMFDSSAFTSMEEVEQLLHCELQMQQQLRPNAAPANNLQRADSNAAQQLPAAAAAAALGGGRGWSFSAGTAAGVGSEAIRQGVPAARALSAPVITQQVPTAASGVPAPRRSQAAALVATLRDLTAEYAELSQSLDALA